MLRKLLRTFTAIAKYTFLAIILLEMIQGEPSFSMPSAEELQAKIAEWEPKLVGKYIKQDSVDVDLSSVDPSNIVKVSDLPQPVRVIRPGTLVTRDLRPHRMNVKCDADGKIHGVSFH